LDSIACGAAPVRNAATEAVATGDATVVNAGRAGSAYLARSPLCDRYVLASTSSGTVVAARCETPEPRRRPCYL
jgi:hypothetical protein